MKTALKIANNKRMNLPERSITRQTLYAMYEKDKINT